MNSYAGAVLGQLDRLFNRGTVAGLSEGALLERYVSDGDEAAFAAIVARHGPMVLGVCRRVLRDERDVEDAFQATFLVLVRRAAVIREGDLVGRWLHGVAHRVAVRARAHSARRHVRERSPDGPIEAGATGSIPADIHAERRELAAIVDEEVMRLPSTLRQPVVLCYLEGMSHDEAARRLRWPVGTVRSRMARARDVLRRRLARRGVTADGAAIATAFARLPVPPEWLDATVRGSLNFAIQPATAAAIATARSVAIARRVLHTMFIAKLSCVGAAGLGIVLALGGVRTLAFTGAGRADAAGPASAASPGPGGQAEAPKDATRPGSAGDRHTAETLSREVLMMREMAKIREELNRSSENIDRLSTHLKNVEAELDSIHRVRRQVASDPAAVASPPDAAPVRGMPTAAQPQESRTTAARPAPSRSSPPPTKSMGSGDPNRPRYINMGHGSIIVVSPDGTRIANYEPQSGKSRPIRLPAVRGVRREINLNAPAGIFAPKRSRTGLEMTYTNSPWFIALDLDRENKVTRIAAFHVLDETWIEKEIAEPVELSSVKIAGSTIYTIGRRIYAFSDKAKRWGVLEFPDGAHVAPITTSNPVWAEKDGRLYLFNAGTGNWDDIYARAIEDAPSLERFDTRNAPAQ